MRGAFSLDDIRSELRETRAAVVQIASSLSDAQFNWKPPGGGWSAGECVEHLSVVGGKYASRIERLDTSRMSRGSGPWRGTFIGRMFRAWMEPPARGRVKAPQQFHPAESNLERESTIARYVGCSERLESSLSALEGVDLGRQRVSSPISKWIRFDLASAFAIIAAHERRHIDQIRSLTRSPDFPA